LTPLEEMPKNAGDANGFKKLPKVQQIAKSGNTGHNPDHRVPNVTRTILCLRNLFMALVE